MASESLTTQSELSDYRLREIHLQISLLEDSIKNDRLNTPWYQSGFFTTSLVNANQSSSMDAAIFERQYAERTQTLRREFEKLYRLVVWGETSKDFKRHTLRKALPFSLTQGDITFQCQTLQNASTMILKYLPQDSENYRYAQQVVRAFIKRWYARRHQYEQGKSQVSSQSSDWPSPVYLLEENPLATIKYLDPEDPYNCLEEPNRLPFKPIGFMGASMGLCSALLACVNSLFFVNTNLEFSYLGGVVHYLGSLSTALVLGLQIGTGIVALSCGIFIALKGPKGSGATTAGMGCLLMGLALIPWVMINGLWAIPLVLADVAGMILFFRGYKIYHEAEDKCALNYIKLTSIGRRLSKESVEDDLVFIGAEEDEDAIEKNSDAEWIDWNNAGGNYAVIFREKKKTLHRPIPGTLIGERLKSQSFFGMNYHFPSTMFISPLPRCVVSQNLFSWPSVEMTAIHNISLVSAEDLVGPSKNPVLTVSVSNALTDEKKGSCIAELIKCPLEQAFAVVEQMHFQDQKSFNVVEQIRSIFVTALSQSAWNQPRATDCFENFLDLRKLLQFPEIMWLLYQDLRTHNKGYNQSHPNDPVFLMNHYTSFQRTIFVYLYLLRSDIERKNATMDQLSHSIVIPKPTISAITSKEGFFHLPQDQKDHTGIVRDPLKQLLLVLSVDLGQACQRYPLWSRDLLEHLPKLPWPLCIVLIPRMINAEADRYGNTLLHQLAKHPQCSVTQLEGVLQEELNYCKKMNYSGSHFLSYRNREGHSAAQVAFAADRMDLLNVFHRYQQLVSTLPITEVGVIFSR